MASRYNQLTMLYIFNILKLDASPKKPYSAPMVHRRLKELGIGLDRKTVFNHMRILTDQMLSAEQAGDSFFRQYLCSKLYRCRKEESRENVKENGMESGIKSNIESGYRICPAEEEIPENCVLYYYIEDEMSPEELELLQSTVAINQYLSAEKTGEILADLEHKKPFDCRERFLYTAFADPKLKNHATDIFASLSVIRDSIRKKKKLSILYGRYDKRLKLAPTSDAPRAIDPYAVMSSNGYYYLIAGNPKYPDGLTNFRIDRILQIQMLDEPRKSLPDQLLPYFRDAAHEVFQASEYRNDHPVMYSDETVRIHLSCNPAIINNLIDDFGWSIQSRDIKDPDHPDWVHVTAKASLMGAAIFCTHHCKDCKVIGPDKLREKVIENLRAGLALYE